mgnify:CR=1 FL=1
MVGFNTRRLLGDVTCLAMSGSPRRTPSRAEGDVRGLWRGMNALATMNGARAMAPSGAVARARVPEARATASRVLWVGTSRGTVAKVPSRLGRPHSWRPELPPNRRRAITTRAADDPDRRRPGFNKKRLASPKFSEEAQTWALLGGIATSLTAIVAVVVAANNEAAYFGSPDDFSYMGDDFTGGPSLDVSPGNVAAAAIWSFGLFFKSPLQILLVFLGRTDTERPSDWLLRKSSGEAEETRTWEEASAPQKAALIAFFTACGCGVVSGFDALFAGEETWALSAGLGFTMLAFVAELGSPRRYSRAELDVLEAQYADFVAFADEALERRGRCHGSEVERAFRRRFGKYTEAVLSDRDLRTMILNWHPNAERTSAGYYKNLSVKEGVDRRNPVTVKDLGL